VAVDGSVIDAVANVDPFEVAEMRDFGAQRLIVNALARAIIK
jgi:hypothetical protein